MSQYRVTGSVGGLQKIERNAVLLVSPVGCHSVWEIGFSYALIEMLQYFAGRILLAGIDQAEGELGEGQANPVEVTTVLLIIINAFFISVAVTKLVHDNVIGGIVIHAG